ncbi:MAG: tRNA uridine-5-carboxymethylaminomethyl(34) synthesis GTPase MnmE [Pseudomonadota bacterium]
MARETIYALASGQGVCGVAVVRVSGPEAWTIVERLSRNGPPPPRQAALRRLYDHTGALLDEALVLCFAEGASFTGEAVAELHCHGGRAVVRAVLSAVAAAAPCRAAEPGEFTWRAFEQGRLDLARVEALGDLLAAETEAQRRQAARLMEGALHTRAEGWRGALVRALALVEVTIDWADEEVPEDVSPEVALLLGEVAREIAAELGTAEAAARLRTGFEVALIGAPNAGKSSLLNALAGREAAITSAIPGTTRDVLELRYDLDGLPVTFLDTAGLRETADDIEAIGVARARARAEQADLRLLLVAPDAPAPAWGGLCATDDILVRSKADLGGEGAGVPVSALTGQGIPALLEAIRAGLGARAEGGLIAHRRQHEALASGLAALRAAEKGLDQRGAEEVSEDIRTGLGALERLIGRVGVEDVLGEVFSRFCLGK